MKDSKLEASPSDFAVIERRYLLVLPIPCHVDASGAVWLDRLWHRDLVEHLTYLNDFVLCAPSVPRDPRADLVRFEAPPGVRASFVFLPPQTSLWTAALHLPRTAATLWRAIGNAEIVHSAVGGWPYPLGWLANPMALLRRRPLVIVVESPWRMGRRRLKHRLMDMDPIRHWMARWSCRHARLALFTQGSYREALCGGEQPNAYVTPAVWVNEADMLDDGEADASWVEKLRGPVRLLFAGRLVQSKGVEVLLAALRSLESRAIASFVDVIGQGELRGACVKAASEFQSVRLGVLDPVQYGRDFFELLRRYHAVVVPSLSDEQPRIVFDANSQAVAVIASATDGLKPYVDHGRTGWLIRSGDVPGLASAIARATSSPIELRALGLAALRSARGATHRGMHCTRSHLLRKHCA